MTAGYSIWIYNVPFQCSKNIPSRSQGPNWVLACRQSTDLFLPCNTDIVPGSGKPWKKVGRRNEPEAFKVKTLRRAIWDDHQVQGGILKPPAHSADPPFSWVFRNQAGDLCCMEGTSLQTACMQAPSWALDFVLGCFLSIGVAHCRVACSHIM